MNTKLDSELAAAYRAYRKQVTAVASARTLRRPYRELFALTRHLQREGSIDRETALTAVQIAEAGLQDPKSRATSHEMSSALSALPKMVRRLRKLGVDLCLDDEVIAKLVAIQELIPETLPDGFWPWCEPESMTDFQDRLLEAAANALESKQVDGADAQATRSLSETQDQPEQGAAPIEDALTPFTAPRDVHRLRDAAPFKLRLLAMDLGLLNTQEQKKQWQAFSTPEERAQFTYDALVDWDRTNHPACVEH